MYSATKVATMVYKWIHKTAIKQLVSYLGMSKEWLTPFSLAQALKRCPVENADQGWKTLEGDSRRCLA